MTRRTRALSMALAVALALTPGLALGDPPTVPVEVPRVAPLPAVGVDPLGTKPQDGVVRVLVPSKLETPASTYYLPPGYFFPDAKYTKLDTEVKSLQSETLRLSLENKSLLASASASPPTGRAVLVAIVCFAVGAVVSGVVTGVVVKNATASAK